MKIHEIMTREPRCVRPTDSLAQAALVLRDLDVGSVLVCENDRIVGILTDRDISIRAVAEGRDPHRTPVRDVMSTDVSFVFDTDDIQAAVEHFERDQVRRLPVLSSADKRLVGIVSLGDLAVDADARLGGEVLREVSTPAHPLR